MSDGAQLLSILNLNAPSLSGVRKYAQRGEQTTVLSVWRDMIVNRLREMKFTEFDWHANKFHPRMQIISDYLSGLVSLDELNTAGSDFMDIYSMGVPPSGKRHINWAAYPSAAEKMTTDYSTWLFATSLPARYWKSGSNLKAAANERPPNPTPGQPAKIFLETFMEVTADFCRNQKHTVEKDCPDIKQRTERYKVNWTVCGDNCLSTAMRVANIIKSLAVFAKSLPGPDRPKAWNDVLWYIGSPLAPGVDDVDANDLAAIALSLIRDHIPPLLDLYEPRLAAPNQRQSGLLAVMIIARLFPPEEYTYPIPNAMQRAEHGIGDYLHCTFSKDGGQLEQSFNYNIACMKELQGLAKAYHPGWAEKLGERADAYLQLISGLRMPTGGVPQVGNNRVAVKALWKVDSAVRDKFLAEQFEYQDLKSWSPRYTSVYFPYSGYCAMRRDWKWDSPYLFFMCGRNQRGHSMRDFNAIQVCAYGRHLIASGGSPTYDKHIYGEDSKLANFYVSEHSSFKVNTVIVDGQTQTKPPSQQEKEAFEKPCPAKWYTGPALDFIESDHTEGYGDGGPANYMVNYPNGRPVVAKAVSSHRRRVTFLKQHSIWIVEDVMTVAPGVKRNFEYTQIWRFMPYMADTDERINLDAGFKLEHLLTKEKTKATEPLTITSVDPSGPNVALMCFGAKKPIVKKYFGSRDPVLGWFSRRAGEVIPAPDFHVNWMSDDSPMLVTVIAASSTDQPIISRAADTSANGIVSFEVTLADGCTISYRGNETATKLPPIPGAVTDVQAQSILIATSGQNVVGVTTGCVWMEGRRMGHPDFVFSPLPPNQQAAATGVRVISPLINTPTGFHWQDGVPTYT